MEDLCYKSISQHALDKHWLRSEGEYASYFILQPKRLFKLLGNAVKEGTFVCVDQTLHGDVTGRMVVVFDVRKPVGRVPCAVTAKNPQGTLTSYKVRGVYEVDGTNVTLYPILGKKKKKIKRPVCHIEYNRGTTT